MVVVNRDFAGYTHRVAEKEATGRGTPKYERRTTAATWRYFFVRMLAHLHQWVGLGRDGFGRAGVSFRAGVPTLSCARPPVWNREAD